MSDDRSVQDLRLKSLFGFPFQFHNALAVKKASPFLVSSFFLYSFVHSPPMLHYIEEYPETERKCLKKDSIKYDNMIKY